MGVLIICAVILVLALGLSGVLGRGFFGTLSRLLLLLLFLTFAALTVFCLYGAVAWSDRGSGVLFLGAIPAGVIAWIAFGMLTSSLAASRYYEMPPDQQREFARETFDDTRKLFTKTIEENERKLKRFWLRPDKRLRLKRETAEARSNLRMIQVMEQRYLDSAGEIRSDVKLSSSEIDNMSTAPPDKNIEP